MVSFTIHVLLCVLIPNRPWTVLVCDPGVGDSYATSHGRSTTVLPPQSLTPGYSYCPRTPNAARTVTGHLGPSCSSHPELARPQPCPWGPFPAPHPSTHPVLTLKTPRASPVQALVTDSPGANSKPLFSPPSQTPSHSPTSCSPRVGHTDGPL